MKSTFIVSLILLAIISCSPKTKPTASNAKTEAAGDSLPTIDLTVAENQFRQTCSSCHVLPQPNKHTAAEWPNTIERMQRKKGFDNNQKAQILAYLTANAKK